MENIETQLIELIATDRIHKPISSMSGKLKRNQPKIARGIDLREFDFNFEGDRTYARVEFKDVMKARGMRDGVEIFSARFPVYGEILNDLIEEQRESRETHLCYDMHEGRRLTSADYMGVMKSLGFSDSTSESLYPELMDISYKLARKRGETERRILIG